MSEERRGRGGGEGVRTRDHLANSRNLLGWCRLCAALIAIGFSVDKLGQLENLGGNGSLGRRWVGLFVATTAIGVITAASFRFVKQRAAIETAEFRPNYRTDVAIAALAAIGGLVAMISLVIDK